MTQQQKEELALYKELAILGKQRVDKLAKENSALKKALSEWIDYYNEELVDDKSTDLYYKHIPLIDTKKV